ncbi:hypothetical protein [Solibacillus sp. FSL H8-0538]|uniref:hypothetical protein n=1 Tax=Solibacillus sp. FSL H8-0538 TaxID=2921400 RepID=UPI0030FCA790
MRFGKASANYFTALVNMFETACTIIAQDEALFKSLTDPFERILQNAEEAGWGMDEVMHEIYWNMGFPDEKIEFE